MSKHRFVLEQHIMNCWNVVDDIKAIHTAHQDRREMSVDEMSNVLMGLEHLYRIKFEALFECFEKHLMEIHELDQEWEILRDTLRKNALKRPKKK